MNLDRVQKKGDNLSYQEHDKDKTFQHKKRKGTLPRIASPAKMNTSEEEFSDDTSPIEKGEGVNYGKDDKNKKYDENKKPEFPDDTSTVVMEEGIIERRDESKKIYMMREKRLNALMTPPY